MTLSDRQANFLQDFAKFILWCHCQGYKVTAGELFRTEYQQAEYVRTGRSKADHSKHEDKLAGDLNFFFGGVYMFELSDNTLKAVMTEIGEKWESMRAGNRWGGNFESLFDPGHFEAA